MTSKVIAKSTDWIVPRILTVLFYSSQNCDLSGCDLQEANLRGSNVKGAIFEEMLTALHMSQSVR